MTRTVAEMELACDKATEIINRFSTDKVPPMDVILIVAFLNTVIKSTHELELEACNIQAEFFCRDQKGG